MWALNQHKLAPFASSPSPAPPSSQSLPSSSASSPSSKLGVKECPCNSAGLESKLKWILTSLVLLFLMLTFLVLLLLSVHPPRVETGAERPDLLAPLKRLVAMPNSGVEWENSKPHKQELTELPDPKTVSETPVQQLLELFPPEVAATELAFRLGKTKSRRKKKT